MKGVKEVFDAAAQVVVALGVVGLIEDEAGGSEADSHAVVIESVVESGGGLVGHGLELGLGELHGLFAEPFEAFTEVFVLEPAVEGGAADAGVTRLDRERSGPEQVREGRELPLGQVFGEMCSVLFHSVPPHSCECCWRGPAGVAFWHEHGSGSRKVWQEWSRWAGGREGPAAVCSPPS